MILREGHRKGFVDDKTREKLEKEEAKIRQAAKELETHEKKAGACVVPVWFPVGMLKYV